MNKRLLALLCIFTIHLVHGQGGYKLLVAPSAAYELNMLKSPSSWVDASGNRLNQKQLWQSAPLIGANVRFSSFTKDKKQHFFIASYYDQALFLSGNTEAGEFSATSGYKFRGKNFLTAWTLAFRDYKRTGQDEDNLIGAPLSYKRWTLKGKFDFRTSKKSHLLINPFSVAKYYDMNNYERFMYVDNGLEAMWAYQYKFKTKIGYSFDAGFHQRNYFLNKESQTAEELEFEDEEIEENEEEIEELFETEESETTYRTWRYYTAGVGIRMPVSTNFVVKGGVAYNRRSDIIQGILGYHQLTAELGLTFKKGKFKSSFDLSARWRDYTDFEINNTSLSYNYYAYDIKMKYQFTQKFGLQLSKRGKYRQSNVTDINRRTARSYFTSQFGLSAIWTLTGNYKR